MAVVCRHDSLPLRVAAVALAFCFASTCALFAQGEAPSSDPAAQPASFAPAAAPSTVAPQERVLDIRVVGNNAISREKVLANIGTRVDRPFDQATYENDIRKLSTKNWFVHVQPRTERVPGGIIITLEVVERPVLQYVHYVGNKKVKSRKTLEKETNVKKGDALDPYAIQEGARKLETFYQAKGFNNVKVTVREGTKPGDKGAVFLINEGKIQKFSTVKFVGNSYNIAPDGRLKTLIQSKPPLLWLFKGQVDPKKIDEDVQKLETHYRSLGFFKAHVGREFEYNEAEDRVALVFYINEGPRYKVRDISFIGNDVYPADALNVERALNGGDFFNQARMNADINTVKDLYGSNGYVFADVTAELKFDEEPGLLDLVYQVSEGDQYRIGEISIVIKGDNPHTRYSTVLNRSSMRPGDIADIRQFRATERRIKASALFNVDPSKGDVPRVVFSPPDSEDAIAKASKKRASAKRTGDPDSFRGQSPDSSSPGGGVATPAAAPGYMPYPTKPRQPSPPAGGSTVRGQSPDGSSYGGRAVNPITPGPQPYSTAQPTSSYPSANSYPAQPANNYPVQQAAWTPIGNSYPGGIAQAPPVAAPPGYTSSVAPPPLPPPPGYQGGPIINPPPGSVLAPEPPLLQPSIPVEIMVNEAQTGKFMFGAGVNSNAGLVGSIVIDEQNFDIWRVPTSWEDVRTGRAFRGAGQKFRIEAAPGTQVSRYLFNFAEPYLFDTPVSFGLSGYYFNRFYRNWNEQRAGGRTSLGYQFTPDLSGNVALRAEDILISNPSTNTVPDLNAVLGHTQLYSVKPQISYDTRDSTFLPTQGMFFSTDLEYAFGTFQFPRYMLNFQQHYLMRERPDGSGRHTLSFYTQFGISGNDTPIYERFYAGGFGTLRGWQFRGASPMINNVEVGGRMMNVNSLEYMFPITADDMLKGVVFVDYGTVEYKHSFDWDDYRIAPGIGLRVTIPMISLAPIALDFAFPVHKAADDLTQTFSFFVGVGH